MLLKGGDCVTAREGSCHFYFEGKSSRDFSLTVPIPPLEEAVQCMTQMNAFHCTFTLQKSPTRPTEKADAHFSTCVYSPSVNQLLLRLLLTLLMPLCVTRTPLWLVVVNMHTHYISHWKTPVTRRLCARGARKCSIFLLSIVLLTQPS